MDAQSLSTCISITKEFMSRPLNAFFSNPVSNDELPGYDEVISTPMDFSKVESKLFKHEYQSTSEWFKDVCLIYENAIKYHTEETIWGVIAKQLLHDFTKLANGLQARSSDEWIELLDAQTKKFGSVISSSPLKLSTDSLVQGCIKRSEGMPHFPQDKIPNLISKLNKMFELDEVKVSVLNIIKSTHKDPPLTYEEDTVTIEIDKLKDQALNAIYFYVQALE